jgi:hypothetical protein
MSYGRERPDLAADVWAALAEWMGGLPPEQIVRALLARDLEELAAAGRQALLPVLPAPPLLSTGSVARAAEALTLTEDPGPAKPGNRIGYRPGGGRRP